MARIKELVDRDGGAIYPITSYRGIYSEEGIPLSQDLDKINDRLVGVEDYVEGSSLAYVFNTVAEMDEWLAIPENLEELKVGTILYIRDKTAQDYWWDGETRQESKAKVDLSAYDEKIKQLSKDIENTTKAIPPVDNALSTSSVNPVQNNIVTSAINKITEGEVKISQEAYNALGSKVNSDGIKYYIVDGDLDADCSAIEYDNTKSKLISTNVKSAIDELAGECVELTQAEYDALGSEKLTNGVKYFITDQGNAGAVNVSYNNTDSKLTSNDVQGAIDELSKKVVFCTKAEYDKIGGEKYINDVVYYISDYGTSWNSTNLLYNNSQSGLNSSDVQGAIDEIVAALKRGGLL